MFSGSVLIAWLLVSPVMWVFLILTPQNKSNMLQLVIILMSESVQKLKD